MSGTAVMRETATPSTESWSAHNQRWLSARIGYWRRRIEDQASDEPVDPVSAPPEDEGFESAAEHIATLFGLSPFETELLVLAAGIEIDAALRDCVARAQGSSPGRSVRLSFSLALTILPEPHWDALSPLRPLRAWSLLDFDGSSGFGQMSLRIDERMLHYLTGVPAFDERLRGHARLEVASTWQRHDLITVIAQQLESARRPVVVLVNASGDAVRRDAGRALAGAAFDQVGLRMLRLDIAAANDDPRDAAELARRVDREAALSEAGVLITVDGDGSAPARAVRLVAALMSPVVVLGAVPEGELGGRPVTRFSVPPPVHRLPPELPLPIQRAANRALQQFRVGPALLDQALDAVSGISQVAEVDRVLWQTLREGARGGLDALAQRIDSRATFDDVVVPQFVGTQLREIAAQLQHRQTVYEDWGFGRQGRGLGIAALFVGESGTGKTLAAEAIATETRLDLYRIDLANVVSKYIGETEKNLGRVFEAAEASGAILLFDECDALFGKRSEVKDSHDRYANIEVAYLLQRIESYRGLAILTTNMKSALDHAFLRRIRFIVQFPFPDVQARARIWTLQFPPAAPVGDVDITGLAKLQLTGGSIRVVAMNAAFKAAAGERVIDQVLLSEAAHAEHAKLERTMSTLGAGNRE